ncbi:hypothetical protein DAI22_09g157200 [Oryza sativa Japonica Group]|jgi:hypothetical protein|nr:hypothetical protein DAI22_09g157200 [Oryza sativa Japonica Group]
MEGSLPRPRMCRRFPMTLTRRRDPISSREIDDFAALLPLSPPIYFACSRGEEEEEMRTRRRPYVVVALIWSLAELRC